MITKKVCWQSPSNLAIVKYWGKYGMQIPMNPSISFTLDKSYTETTIELLAQGKGNIEFTYDGSKNEKFANKVKRFLNALELYFINDFDLKIDSKNTFPHSAGIASSASAMSAIALCITELQFNLEGRDIRSDEFLKMASYRSRLGSGSACRSLFSTASLWGRIPNVPQSSDEYGIDWSANVHNNFKDIQDWIFIINKEEKSVSSTAGHELMKLHPYRDARIQQANDNIHKLIKILSEGDWNGFIDICEEEALTLHGLMMSSRPGYLLLEPDSIRIIQAIRKFRNETNINIGFSIDAGPNIHMLFPQKFMSEVASWCKTSFGDYYNHGKIIFDQIGKGPKQIIL
ncbi:MAG: diphosphomevalonate decarboxylase [Saprospiraceae bacterium]|nr:diphosphomevalonate decarboxylase [Candidatus Vicinibacter affinis]